MRKLYYLKSCSTCQRIIKELGIENSDFEFQNIKEKNISAEELDAIQEKVGSYEALFSKKATKYRELGLNLREQSEKEYRKYILQEYTFLKRPVFVIDGDVFVGNSKANVEAVAKCLAK